MLLLFPIKFYSFEIFNRASSPLSNKIKISKKACLTPLSHTEMFKLGGLLDRIKEVQTLTKICELQGRSDILRPTDCAGLSAFSFLAQLDKQSDKV